MLWHPQLKTNSTHGTGARVLGIGSNLGANFVLCDMGLIEFCVTAKDLSRRNSGRVYTKPAGG